MIFIAKPFLQKKAIDRFGSILNEICRTGNGVMIFNDKLRVYNFLCRKSFILFCNSIFDSVAKLALVLNKKMLGN